MQKMRMRVISLVLTFLMIVSVINPSALATELSSSPLEKTSGSYSVKMYFDKETVAPGDTITLTVEKTDTNPIYGAELVLAPETGVFTDYFETLEFEQTEIMTALGYTTDNIKSQYVSTSGSYQGGQEIAFPEYAGTDIKSTYESNYKDKTTSKSGTLFKVKLTLKKDVVASEIKLAFLKLGSHQLYLYSDVNVGKRTTKFVLAELMESTDSLTFSVGGNGSEEGTSYTITTDSGIQNGSISVVSSAVEGATVNITATPDTGYELDTLTVKDANEQDVTVTGNTFTMPASNVTVSATFKKVSYNVTTSSGGNGTISVKETANYGDTVTITALPSEGYALKTLTVTKNDGSTVAASGTGNSYTFTMPAANVTVSATFAIRPATPTISPSGGAVAYNTRLTITAPEGATVYYTNDGSEPTLSTGTTWNSNIAYNITRNQTFKAIAVVDGVVSNVATETFTLANVHNLTSEITGSENEHCKVTLNPSDTAAAGQSVSLQIADDYSGVEFKGATMTVNGVTTDLSLNYNSNGAYYWATFTMPDADVKITATYADRVQKTFEVVSSTGGSLQLNETSTYADTIYATATADSNYRTSRVEYSEDGGETWNLASVDVNNRWTIPYSADAANVKVRGVFTDTTTTVEITTDGCPCDCCEQRRPV
jgi:hypothetical protein